MAQSAHGEEDRRGGGTERRRYNRRSAPPTVTPPYFETFERIAAALESISATLNARQVTAPEATEATPQPVRPRTSAEGR